MSARASVLAAAAALLLLAQGCAAPTIAVDVETPTRRGRGVIVGPHTVLTVGHVVVDTEKVKVDDHPARVISRHLRATESGDDGLVVLELLDGTEFPPERVATLALRAHAGVSYLPARGETPWPWGLEPGDSGSPILDNQGRVTGLVRAVFGRAEPLDQPALSALQARDDS